MNEPYAGKPIEQHPSSLKMTTELERLRAELEEITKHRDALWGEHSNEPADRYWETRWRDEAAENYDLLAENKKLREALSALAKHCNNMEAQNHDYHTMGEGGAPCISEPLANAYAIMKEGGDE